MQRDLKIGLLAGLVIVGAATLYICTRPALSPQARILETTQQVSDQTATISIPDTKPQQPSYPPEHTVPEVSNNLPSEPAQPIFQETPITLQPASSESSPVEPDIYNNLEKIKTTRFYIVRKGDTLSKISKKYYGTPNKWRKIYEANHNVLGDNPDLLQPGEKLIIPDD